VQFGINIPVDLVYAIDAWAREAGYLRGDGGTNRSGAVKAILMMALTDGNIMDAAIRARRIAMVGTISDRLRQLYLQVHKIMMDEIDGNDEPS
jgi:hypothetical protein